MCGRYSLTRRQEDLIERFGIEQFLSDAEHTEPRFNIAPSQMVPVIVNQEGKRCLANLKWGLIPFWAKDLISTKPVINARCESLSQKPFFKQAVKKKRCLIPADGFYEWKHQNKTKVPMYIHMPERTLFAFAGLWDEWTSPDGEVIRTCTIITKVADEFMASVHDRMPVIVKPELESLWLDQAVNDVHELSPILYPEHDCKLAMYQVSAKVNKAAYDSAEMVEPAPVPEQASDPVQKSLFEPF